MNELDRMPPYNKEAEQSVLGGMLRDNSVINDVLMIIGDVQYFYTDAHQKIFRGIVDLHDKSRPADPVTIADWLKDHKYIEDIGGYSYIDTLWYAAPSAANAQHYAQIVRDKGMTRILIHTLTNIIRDAYDQAMPATKLLDEAEQKVLSIRKSAVSGQAIHAKEYGKRALEQYERIAGGTSEQGLPYGFYDLDQMTCGMHAGELIIVAARPSIGKSCFAEQVVNNVSEHQHVATYIASLEQSGLELASRFICRHGRVCSYKWRKGVLNDSELKSVHDSLNKLYDIPIWIGDSNFSLNDIVFTARRLHWKEHIRLIVVDYLQLVDVESRNGSKRYEQIGQISRRLKLLAKELNIPILCVSQLNRGPEERKGAAPRLSDLRESGNIEQDADTVLLLHRPDYYEPGQQEGMLEVIVAKQRNGPTGSATLAFLKQFMRFENFAPEVPYDYEWTSGNGTGDTMY